MATTAGRTTGRTNRYSRQSYPFGIVVNAEGERFIDEGADFRNYTYAKYGAEVLRQPQGFAAQVFDARTAQMLRTVDYEAPGATRVDADTLAKLAAALGIDAERFERTVDEDARVLGSAGRPLQGLFAAGELVGGLFFHNYPGGTGLTAGAVYGRRAGYAAAG
jgi:tricarballylate dehydrogenase